MYAIVGIFTYPSLALFNKLKISGTENLKGLPKQNVLIVSNHQTYFADVIAILHTLCAVKWKKKNRLGLPYYLLNPFTNIYYVAAYETMKKNWLSKLFTMAGAITVKRTWNKNSVEKRKGLDPSDTRNILRALKNNWVLQFPQGTTTPFAPARKGTAHIIKMHQPIVVPIVVNGFSTAFDKKGLRPRKKGTTLSVRIKEPIIFNADATVDDILDQVVTAIEQKQAVPA